MTARARKRRPAAKAVPAGKGGKAKRRGAGKARAAAAPRRPRRGWPQLTARDVMRRDVITVDRTTPLSEVERILTENRITGAPVTDETGQIVGVISMRDLVERYVEDPDARPRRGRAFYRLSSEELLDDDFETSEIPEETEETAEDVMTAEVLSVPDDAPLSEVAATMVKHRIHRVLVASRGHFAGIVGTFEILDALTQGGDR
ncbi:MAG: CBS domain-containing protein [Planctomycetes bacterium]|nr:CBS domain-containing protein [Planctomycetota bacterium]